MQVHVEIGEDLPETVITIRCREKTPYINKLIAALKIVDRQIVVNCGGNITSESGCCFVYRIGGQKMLCLHGKRNLRVRQSAV